MSDTISVKRFQKLAGICLNEQADLSSKSNRMLKSNASVLSWLSGILEDSMVLNNPELEQEHRQAMQRIEDEISKLKSIIMSELVDWDELTGKKETP